MRKEAAKLSILQQKNECMNFFVYLKLINIPVILHSCSVRKKRFSSVVFHLRMIYGYFAFCNKSFLRQVQLLRVCNLHLILHTYRNRK